jgi:hypothetical protein
VQHILTVCIQISVFLEACYFPIIACIKLSFLALYGEIFPQRYFHHLLWAFASFIAMWLIASLIVTVFQCIPISFVWDRDQEGYCLDYSISVLVLTIVNIVTDFVLLAMPVPLVRKLVMSRQKKRLICGTFALGGR